MPPAPDRKADKSPSPASTPTREILRGIRRIIRVVDLRSRQLYRQTGLTIPQMLCLRAIQEGTSQTVTAAEIARRIQLSPRL